MKFSDQSNLEELDLSLNNLSDLNKEFFSNLRKLKVLKLKETYLQEYKFILNQFSQELKEIDLCGNEKFADESLVLNKLTNIETLILSNTSLEVFDNDVYTFLNLKYLDVSSNKIKSIENLCDKISFLNLSYNSFEYFLNEDLELKDFLLNKLNLKVIDLTKSLSTLISDKIFMLNKILLFPYDTIPLI